MPARVLSLVTDMIFSTKIQSTARTLGVQVVPVRSLDVLTRELAAGPVSLLLVDLNATSLDPMAAIKVVRAVDQPPRILAFFSHVQAELAQQAKAAGADQVVPRSVFTVQLPAILQSASDQNTESPDPDPGSQ